MGGLIKIKNRRDGKPDHYLFNYSLKKRTKTRELEEWIITDYYGNDSTTQEEAEQAYKKWLVNEVPNILKKNNHLTS